ncbi:MAG: hypothetical protein IKW21_01190 [Lachnospiraceae bacterium]|nr:hypothetical protein [Lachnospiraceae bacterium]
MKYYINGWEESKSYFMSFGFTRQEKEDMMAGKVIVRNDNEFSIVADQEGEQE